MKNGGFYTEVLKTNDVVSEFQNSLTLTNRSYKFFVDWEKAKKNVAALKVELGILDSLVGSKNVESDLRKLLKDYPEVLRAFPILFAIRDTLLVVVEDFNDTKHNFSKYDFNKNKGNKLTNEEIDNYIRLAKNTGIIYLFDMIKNFKDYVLGVEVGMDTNARKNRSGSAMEILIKPLLDDLSKKYGFDILTQTKFKAVETKFNAKVPQPLSERKADFILHKNGKLANIEVNYYEGSGSKPEEIVDSYINRYNELKKYGWNFVWITDGNCWRTAKNQLSKGFDNIEYVLNLYFIRKGLLKNAIEGIFGK